MNNVYVKTTRVSGNSKTGAIPTTITSANTCPDNCSLKGQGCYAEYGMVGMHWRRVSTGKQSGTWNDLLRFVSGLPSEQLWRHNIAGDLPSLNGFISAPMVLALMDANAGNANADNANADNSNGEITV